jgi:Flp pilus assembly protein TadG
MVRYTREGRSDWWSKRTRRAFETVEFALILPLLMTLGLGGIEFSRALSVQQVLTNAAREGAREAVLPASSVSEVEGVVAENLKIGRIDATAVDVTITPASLNGLKSGNRITVGVRVPYSKVSWLPVPRYLGNAFLGSECTMRHE